MVRCSRDPWERADGRCSAESVGARDGPDVPANPWERADGPMFPPNPWERADGPMFRPIHGSAPMVRCSAESLERADGPMFPPNPWSAPESWARTG